MNLFYVQAGADTVNLDLMVVATDAKMAHDIWFRVLGEDMDCTSSTPCLVDVAIANTVPGYLEWGSFKFKPVEGV